MELLWKLPAWFLVIAGATAAYIAFFWLLGRHGEKPVDWRLRLAAKLAWYSFIAVQVAGAARDEDAVGVIVLGIAAFIALAIDVNGAIRSRRSRTRGTAALLLLVTIPTAARAAMPIGPPQYHPAGASPFGLVVADFDGDGALDIAVVLPGDDAIALLLGDGTGEFANPLLVATGDDPRALMAADFNGDGDIDLASADFGDDTASIHFGSAGATFAPRIVVPVHAEPTAIAMDPGFWGVAPGVVTLSAGGLTSHYEGDGQGNFFWRTTGQGGANAAGLTSLDFDGDGMGDIVVANAATSPDPSAVTLLASRYEYYKNYFYYEEDTLPSPPAPRGLTQVDLDEGGWPDLVAALSDGATGGIAIWQGDGQTPFGIRTDIAAGVPLDHVISGDIDGDVLPDLAAGGPTGALAIFWNDTGVLSLDQVIPLGEPIAATGVGDMNGDGWVDVVVTLPSTNRVAVLHGGATSGVDRRDPIVPPGVRMMAPAPNPARHHVRLAVEVPDGGPAQVTIFDAAGQRVRGFEFRGMTALDWDLRDDAGRPVAAGRYYARLDAAGAQDARPITVIR